MGNLLTRRDMLMRRFQQELASPAKDVTDVNPFLQKLYVIVDRHLSDSSFSVDQLAFEAAVSISTLNRKLAALIGLSASELIKKYRLKKAAELLTHGHGVAETAYQIGYDSPAHFSTIFKTVYGVAPSEYKRN